MKKVKKLVAAVCMLTVMLLMSITAFAMEPVEAGFYVKNIDKTSITVNISSGDYSKDIHIAGESSEYVSFSFSEPDSYEYTVVKKNAAADEPSYIVRFYVEVAEDGKLQAYVIPQIAGEKVKPDEVTFGHKPEAPKIVPPAKTGDTMNIGLFVGIAVGSALLIVIIILAILLRRAKKENANG